MAKVTLLFEGLGEAATVEDFVVWVAFVAKHIDERCGFEVEVAEAHYREGGPNRIEADSEAQRDTIAGVLDDLWRVFCREGYADERARETLR